MKKERIANYMSLENLDDYIQEFHKYKKGTYDYKSIISKLDIKENIENGKKFVFPMRRFDPFYIKGGIWISLGLIFGLIYGIIANSILSIETWIYIFLIIFGSCGIVGSICFIRGFLNTHNSFIVLGSEGIAYKLGWRSTKGYKWDCIKIDYNGHRFIRAEPFSEHYLFEIHISMPNGDVIKLGHNKYRSKEISLRELPLLLDMFKVYYKDGEIGTFEREMENEKKEDLKDILKKFDILQIIKEVEAGRIPEGNKDEILQFFKDFGNEMYKFRDALNDRGIILEERKKNDEEYIILLERKSKGEPVEDLIKQNRKQAEIFAKTDNEFNFLEWGKSEESRQVFEFLEDTIRRDPSSKRRFDQGVKIINEIDKNMKEYEKLLERRIKGEFVDDLINQNRYTAKLLAEQYKNFLATQHEEIQRIWIKSPDEMLRSLSSDRFLTNAIELIHKEKDILDELMKYGENYKVLLERKNSGEYVKDLIKQSRNQAEILAKKARENTEEIYGIIDKDQMKELFENSEKIVKNWAKAEKEYDNLLKRVKDEKGQKRREFVKELLEKNSIYMEELRINYMKIRAEILGRSIGISPNSKNKKPIMRNSQKCPNCSNIMNYVEYFDGYQCPECKKKYYLWENQLRIIGDI